MINGISLNVRADVKAALKRLGRLQQDKINKATVRALNKTIKTVRTQAVRFIAKDIGIKQKPVRKLLHLQRASRRQLFTFLAARAGKRFTLIQINPRARQTAKGVKVKTQGHTKIIPQGFLATMPGGHRGIYKRTSHRNLPIYELHGTSVTNVFSKAAAMQLMQQAAIAAWHKKFDHELNYELNKP